MMAWMASGNKEQESFEEKNRVSSFRGYLLKLRRSPNLLAPQWGKRWFSIEGRHLNWYRTENDISPSGMVNLKFIRSITKVDSPGSFTFAISCPDRNLVLRCSTMHEMNSWIRAFHIHADIARGGTGMNIVSDFNELPLRANNGFVGSKSRSKLRSSLSLEQELDLNLKKLDELAREVKNPSPRKHQGDASPNGSVEEEKASSSSSNNHQHNKHTHNGRSKQYSKPYNNTSNQSMYDSEGESNVVDVLGKLRDFTSDGVGKNSRHSGGSTGSRDVIQASREDSTNSIEDISIANTRVVNNARLAQQQAQAQATQAQAAAANKNKSTASSNNSNNNNNSRSNERRGSGNSNNQNYGSNNTAGYHSDDPEDGGRHSDFEITSDNSRNNNNNNNRRGGGNSNNGQGPRYVSRIEDSADSYDGIDEGTFTYVPGAARPRQNDRDSRTNRENNSNNYNSNSNNNNSNGGGYGSNSRQSSGRNSAW